MPRRQREEPSEGTKHVSRADSTSSFIDLKSPVGRYITDTTKERPQPPGKGAPGGSLFIPGMLIVMAILAVCNVYFYFRTQELATLLEKQGRLQSALTLEEDVVDDLVLCLGNLKQVLKRL